MGDIRHDKMENNKIIIIGAGGHAAEINDYIHFSNRIEESVKFEIIGFIDDNPENYSRYKYAAPFLGDIKTHEIREDCSYLIGIANLKFRKKIVEDFLLKGANFTSYIHPHAYISDSAVIGSGVVISYLANLGPNTVIGDFTMINARSSIAHDTKVGAFNFIGPNVCLSGFTIAGNDNMFGVNSATVPGVKIGNGNTIAAGMTINRNINDNEIIFYRIKDRVIGKNTTG